MSKTGEGNIGTNLDNLKIWIERIGMEGGILNRLKKDNHIIKKNDKEKGLDYIEDWYKKGRNFARKR